MFQVSSIEQQLGHAVNELMQKADAADVLDKVAKFQGKVLFAVVQLSHFFIHLISTPTYAYAPSQFFYGPT